ncbi:MAG: TOBE domain-containing protein [Desulfovibrionaceae bacterium]|nr:TOBE domain-containing protein [Desulfovibrionaceae bacterium]
MQVSARNVFWGSVCAVHSGTVTDEVIIVLPRGEKIVAVITSESSRSLELAEGREVCAIIKASQVVFMTDADDYRLSARNQFTGRIKKLTRGFVNTEVVMELPSGLELMGIVSLDGASRLRLEQGDTVTAVVKASSVIVAVKK